MLSEYLVAGDNNAVGLGVLVSDAAQLGADAPDIAQVGAHATVERRVAVVRHVVDEPVVHVQLRLRHLIATVVHHLLGMGPGGGGGEREREREREREGGERERERERERKREREKLLKKR